MRAVTQAPAEPARAIVFETTRLVCRRIGANDLDALEAVYGDAAAMRWVGNGEPLSRAMCARWIEVTQANYARRGYGMFALAERGSSPAAGLAPAPDSAGPVFGFCGLVHPGEQLEPEVKYALLASHRGRGLATEAVRALVAQGHARFAMNEIIATVAPRNEASMRVLAKAGFEERTMRRNDDGTFTRVFVHAPLPTR